MAKSSSAVGQPLEPRQPQAARCIAVVLLVLIILTLLIVTIVWLAVQPKKLIYSIERSSINGYSYSRDGHLNATFHCLLRSKNPNKRVSFYFDKIEVVASYYENAVFRGNIGRFYQPARNVTDLEVELAANGTAVRGGEAENLRTESASGNVKLEVNIVSKIRMKIGVFKVHRTATARCGPYDVPLSESKGLKSVVCDTDIYY